MHYTMHMNVWISIHRHTCLTVKTHFQMRLGLADRDFSSSTCSEQCKSASSQDSPELLNPTLTTSHLHNITPLSNLFHLHYVPRVLNIISISNIPVSTKQFHMNLLLVLSNYISCLAFTNQVSIPHTRLLTPDPPLLIGSNVSNKISFPSC